METQRYDFLFDLTAGLLKEMPESKGFVPYVKYLGDFFWGDENGREIHLFVHPDRMYMSVSFLHKGISSGFMSIHPERPQFEKIVRKMSRMLERKGW